MSDVADLTVDDAEDGVQHSSSAPGSAFPEARDEGYDISAVDTYLQVQRSQVEQAHTAARAARAEANALRDEVSRLTAKLAESDKPTYAGLGWRATEIMEQAEAEADKILADAAQAAADIAQLAERDAEDLRSDTTPKVDPGPDIEEERSRLYADAERDREEARHEAERIVDEARGAAEQVRSAAEAQAEQMRDAANADAEESRTAADQEITAARKVLGLERERAANESAEAHRSASELAEQLVSAAEARVVAAEERAHEASSVATQRREQAEAEAEQLLVDARRVAERATESGRTQAEVLLSEAEDADIDHELIKARADLIYYQRQYHVIAAQVVRLHDAASADEEPAEAVQTAETADDAEVADGDAEDSEG